MGFNETIELREQLVHANVTFATEISDIQESINESLKGLTTKLFYLVDRNESSNPNHDALITLTPPVVLILQLIEMTTSSIGNILSTFQNLEIPADPYYLLQQYIPYIDWDDFKEAAKKYKMENSTNSEMSPNEEEQGMGGRRF